jgi:glycosyltransferase A (GT-A) superfamily protein (DUF2064 family)
VADPVPLAAPCEHRLAAVVPAWEEAAAIGGVVRGLRRAGACCVYVVDPGSSDGTPEAARAAGARVVIEPRRGYGRACLSGAVAAAGHDLVAFLDGDGSCDPLDLPRLAAAADGADLVLGRRVGWEPGALGWHARLGNTLVSAALRRRTGRPVRDLPPWKLVRADALDVLGLDATGYGWTVQLVGRALSHPALTVEEVPTTFRTRAGGESKVSGRIGASARAARAMLREAASATRRRGLLVVMAKAPRAGRSKTRLEAALGPRPTAGFWAACLRDAGAKARAAARAAGLDALAMTPSLDEAREVRRQSGLPCLAQRGPGLGSALLEASELPAPFAIMISADAPSLPVERLCEAAEALGTGRAVLGPGVDGGYYLVGLRREVPAQRRRRAFLEAPMGSEGVLAHTRRALGEAIELAPWPDVDTVDELRRLARSLARDPTQAPSVAAWLDGQGVTRGVEPPASPGGPRDRGGVGTDG